MEQGNSEIADLSVCDSLV